MNPTELNELMHRVLDGEASRAERAALEQHLAEDPTARAEFVALSQLFDDLRSVPQAYPPEGLVAGVMARLPAGRPSQPFARPSVVGKGADAPADVEATVAAAGRKPFYSNLFIRGENMNERTGGYVGKRKAWIGAGGIAVVAVIGVVAAGLMGFPPDSTTTTGTIVPAQRYRAPQGSAEGVQPGGSAVSPAQNAATAADSAGTQNQVRTLGAANEVKVQGAANEVKVQGAANEVKLQGAANEVKAQGAANEVKLQGAANEVKAQGAANEVKLQGVVNEAKVQGATTNQVQLQGTTNQVRLQGTANEVKVQGAANEVKLQGAANEAKVQGAVANQVQLQGATNQVRAP